MPSTTPPSLSDDEKDDLIYFSRAGDLPELKETVSNLSHKHSRAPSEIVAAAIEVDADGLGSGCCLLHYPAANGHVGSVEYLLSLLEPAGVVENAVASGESGSGVKEMNGVAGSTAGSMRGWRFVSHQNASGNTPLHWAALNGHLAVCQLLVKHGADLTVKNGLGRDAVVEAEMGGRKESEECAAWLLGSTEGEKLERGMGKETEGEADEVERMEDQKEQGKEVSSERKADGQKNGEEKDAVEGD